ncbi:MAG TPA: rod shape-determining protein MreC [Mycobacteriales bacterium]|nr:rod shape-determining protein MreC [Mycobacteriales bacterium]
MLTVLLLAAFSLITLDYRSSALSGVRSAASTIFGPIEDVVSDVTHPIGSFFSSLGHLGSYKHQNEALQKQIAQLQSQLHLTALERAELAQDQKLLKIASIGQYRVVAARVTAYGGGLGTDQTAMIDRGSVNGIKVNETVINGDGLVGRTVTVGRTTSTILLADDPTFGVGARTAAKQLELGVVSGGGRAQPMSLSLLDTKDRPTVGESLVTAGDTANGDSPFVPEVPIGKITTVNPLNGALAYTATVQPFVDFTAIDIVGVVVHAPKVIKHDSVLPAPPKPIPTVTVTATVTATPGGPGSPPPSSPPASGGTDATSPARSSTSSSP